MESTRRERCPVPRALLHSSSKVSGIRAPIPTDSRFPSDVMEPLCRELPVSGAFVNRSSMVSSREGLPRGPPHLASWERDAPFLEPPSSISQESLVDDPHSRFFSGAPMERDALLQSFFYCLSVSPARKPSLQVPYTDLL